MDLMILKKKIDGYRAANGCIKNVPPELLLELRQSWENYTGTPDQFRSEIGMKMGTLRKFLIESKKLNHVIASVGVVGFGGGENSEVSLVANRDHIRSAVTSSSDLLELVIDHGAKVIRFPNVDTLVDFLRKSA